jgi:hypothetical protein
MTVGERSAPILPAGTVVELSISDGKNVYHVNNNPVEDQVASALEELIGLHTAPVSDGEMLGTDKRRKVGETWMINVDAIRRELDSKDAQGGVISGGGTLERGANNRLLLKSGFEVKDVFLAISPEFNKEKGEMRVRYSRETPLSEPEQTSIETTSLHIVRVGIPKRNKEVTFSIVMDQTSRFETRPITSGKSGRDSSPINQANNTPRP